MLLWAAIVSPRAAEDQIAQPAEPGIFSWLEGDGESRFFFQNLRE